LDITTLKVSLWSMGSPWLENGASRNQAIGTENRGRVVRFHLSIGVRWMLADAALTRS
jgi:hypothetical protein